MRRVNIYGSGRSLATADFKAPGVKWAPGSMLGTFKDWPDLYFCMHDHDPVHQISLLENTGYIDKRRYPLNKIQERYKSSYFTNTIAYMIAYAMHKGFREIHLDGVDLDPYLEWAFERPCVAYWCGRAEGLGIKVYWKNLQPAFLYGYEEKEMDKVIKMLEDKLAIGRRELKAAGSEKEKDQWVGFLFGIEQMLKEIRS